MSSNLIAQAFSGVILGLITAVDKADLPVVRKRGGKRNL
jgi:hypothetical protein